MSVAQPLASFTESKVSSSWFTITASLVGFFFIIINVYGPSGHDDSFITYIAAQQFADTFEILNTNGERVEQGSSLLHVVLLGGLSFITGFEPSLLGQVFSVFFAIACLLMMPSLCRSLGLNAGWPMVLVVLSVSFSYWAVGGLETSLFCLTILFIARSVIRLFLMKATVVPVLVDWRLWLASGLCLLSRPEVPFFLVATALGFGMLSHKDREITWPFVGSWLVITSVLSLGIFAFRAVYFDAFFPQPVYAKSAGFTLEKLLFGVLYFAWSAQLSVIIVSLTAIWVGLRIFLGKLALSLEVQFILSLILAYLAFIIASGGDWMHGGRFFAHIIPLLIVVFLFYSQGFSKRRWLRVGLMVLMIAETLVFSHKLASGIPWYRASGTEPALSEVQQQTYAYTERHNLINRRDIPLTDALKQTVSTLIEQHSERPIRILSIQMGFPPYHLHQALGDKVHFIDLRGLITTQVTQCGAFDASPRNWFGVAINYEQYFSALEQCGLPKPDIVYDLLNRPAEINKQRFQTMLEHGYEMVYEQSGEVTGFGGSKRISNRAFIAVNKRLLKD